MHSEGKLEIGIDISDDNLETMQLRRTSQVKQQYKITNSLTPSSIKQTFIKIFSV